MKPTKTIYVADCIEFGEKFISLFQTNETDKQKLYNIGIEQASGWGAECISVKKWKPKETKMAKLYDIRNDKLVENTLTKINNFIKKNPNSIRYDYSKTQYFTISEPIPTDVWDSDISEDENLAYSKDSPQGILNNS